MNDISSVIVTLPPEERLSGQQVVKIETVIRDMAGMICSQIANRKSHPSYGETKSNIRAAANRMEGAIGLYQVLSGQASHPGVPRLAKFGFPETTERVTTARRLVEEL